MFPIKDNIPATRFPVMNWLIIITNAVVFIYQLQLNDQQLADFFNFFGLVPSRYSSFTENNLLSIKVLTVFPFFTNMFLHGGWLHFILNMWTLVIFGDIVENRMGSFKYLLFYIICGIAASVTHFMLNMHSTVPALGASGAISGVMAAYMFLFPFAKVVILVPIIFIPLFFEIAAYFYIGIWFLLQLWNGALSLSHKAESTGIAFWAHIGGFLSGLVLYKFFLKKKYRIY
jgi:membrane associated rhomboid family serine protease